jgi:hypothetical protein
VVAHRRSIDHAQVAISTARTEWSVIGLVASILEDFEGGMEQVLRQTRYLSRMPTSLDPSPFPNTLRYRENVVPEVVKPGRWAEGGGPLIYLTFGSVAGGLDTAESAFQRAIDAVTGLDARVLVTTGRSFNPHVLGPVPPNVVVESWVPQASIFPFASMVLCHGGSGTTYGALAAGLPIVFVPMFADQRASPAPAWSLTSARSPSRGFAPSLGWTSRASARPSPKFSRRAPTHSRPKLLLKRSVRPARRATVWKNCSLVE